MLNIEEVNEDGLYIRFIIDSSDIHALFVVGGIACIIALVSFLMLPNYQLSMMLAFSLIMFSAGVASLISSILMVIKGRYDATYVFNNESAELTIVSIKSKKEETHVFSYADITIKKDRVSKTSNGYMVNLPGLYRGIYIECVSENESDFSDFLDSFKERRKEELKKQKEIRLLDKIATDTKVPHSVGASTSMAVPASFLGPSSKKSECKDGSA